MTNFLWKTIDRLNGVDDSDILNPPHPSADPHPNIDIAAELASTIKLIRAQSYDPGQRSVDYARLADSPLYIEYRDSLAPELQNFDLNSFPSPKHQKAFWINLYNALVIDAVIQYRIQQSVTEGFLGIIRFFRKSAYSIGSYRFSLDDIEHGILRANRGHPLLPGRHFSASDPRLAFVLQELDPRIHFAINCASSSCPPINTYDANNLDLQLDLAARNYIHQDVKLDQQQLTLCISTIFKWFWVDFGGADGIKNFLQKYLPEGKRLDWLKKQSRPRFDFASYNWALNSPNF